MLMRKISLMLFIGLLVSCSNMNMQKNGTNELKSLITALEFSPEGILFVGDSQKGKISSYKTNTTINFFGKPYNLKEVDQKIAQKYGFNREDVIIRDLAVNPLTAEAYIAVSINNGKFYESKIVILNPNGSIQEFSQGQDHQSVNIPKTKGKDFKFFKHFPSRNLTITDMDYHKGKLYVSGLSNSDFSSTLRVIDYPFTSDSKVKISSIEIFHTNHNQKETRAPIRALDIVNLKGKEYILAAYTCTPLVLIPLSQLKDGAHIVGKVIGELGYGNTPIDLISFTAQDFQKNKFDVVLLNNKNQSAQLMTINDLTSSSKTKGLTAPTYFKNAGIKTINLPLTSLIRLSELDGYHLLSLRRNIDSGAIDLLSHMKNLYYRLSDFESEYEFPDYKYGKNQGMIKNIQNMQKKDEGFGGE